MNLTAKELLKAIKKNCLECCGSRNEIKKCKIKTCPLYKYRCLKTK